MKRILGVVLFLAAIATACSGGVEVKSTPAGSTPDVIESGPTAPTGPTAPASRAEQVRSTMERAGYGDRVIMQTSDAEIDANAENVCESVEEYGAAEVMTQLIQYAATHPKADPKFMGALFYTEVAVYCPEHAQEVVDAADQIGGSV